MATRSCSVRITGKVQGVFFRASSKEKADEFQIKGLARNNADGSVSIEAEGEDENMSAFLEWCNTGPVFSRVDQCEIKEQEIRQFTNFLIDR